MILLFPFLVIAYALLGIYASTSAWTFIKERTRNSLMALLSTIAVFSLFFGGEIHTYLSWQNLCRNDAGVHIYKKTPVDGFFDSSSGAEYIAKSFLESGYKFIEFRKLGREDIYRYSQDIGNVTMEPTTAPESVHSYSMRNETLSNYLLSHSTVIQKIPSGEMAGRNTIYGYSGGFILKLLRRLTGADQEGSATYCYGNGAGRSILFETIPPKGNQVRTATQ